MAAKRVHGWMIDTEKVNSVYSWWKADKLWQLTEMVDRGISDQKIAKALGKTVNAVRVAKYRYGIKSQTEVTFTAKKFARLLDLHPSTIYDFIENGWIRAYRGQRRGSALQWVISREAIIDFFHDWRLWPFWAPEFISDTILRNEATEARTFKVYTLKEVAYHFGVHHNTAMQWARDGKLPAEYMHNIYVVKEDDLNKFVPPSKNRGYTHSRFWDPNSEIILLGLAAEGLDWRQIASVFDRSSDGARIKLATLQQDRGRPWRRDE